MFVLENCIKTTLKITKALPNGKAIIIAPFGKYNCNFLTDSIKLAEKRHLIKITKTNK